jgi:hypothetical protein
MAGALLPGRALRALGSRRQGASAVPGREEWRIGRLAGGRTTCVARSRPRVGNSLSQGGTAPAHGPRRFPCRRRRASPDSRLECPWPVRVRTSCPAKIEGPATVPHPEPAGPVGVVQVAAAVARQTYPVSADQATDGLSVRQARRTRHLMSPEGGLIRTAGEEGGGACRKSASNTGGGPVADLMGEIRAVRILRRLAQTDGHFRTGVGRKEVHPAPRASPPARHSLTGGARPARDGRDGRDS